MSRSFFGPEKDIANDSDFYKFLFSESTFFNLDEVEYAVLFTATILENFDNLDKDLKTGLLELVKSESLSSAFLKGDPLWADRPSEVAIDQALSVIKTQYLPSIRAKLAFLEIFASCLIPEAVSQIIAICPKYFESQLVHQWLRLKQWEYRYSDNSDLSDRAKTDMNLVFNTFKGDKRKIRERTYLYWQCKGKYETLNKIIEAVRSSETPKVAEMFLGMTESHNVPKHYYDRIKNGPTSPAELTLEIMVEQKDIDSPKAFREFQSHTKKLTDRHPAAASDRYAQYFLDFQYKYLESFYKTNIWQILETLPMDVPTEN
ncbi:MAG: hypothetical protein CL676_03515 [Bdellovibrionaceae bacterium]|nr:hypothetical protein [Pseudobdellovibrionaceae bacterium]